MNSPKGRLAIAERLKVLSIHSHGDHTHTLQTQNDKRWLIFFILEK